MYARSFTIHARSSAIDAGIAHIHDTVWPALTGLDGYVGLSLLVDRLTGRCIATTSWQSEEAMTGSRATTSGLRDDTAAILGGSPTVDEWEIAALHRDHRSVPGACVRVTWARVEPELADRAIDSYRLATIPALAELDGFCSASLLADRDSGFGVASVTFDNGEAMRRSRKATDAMKLATVRDSGAEIVDECEFDLVLAHLRVPEMAWSCPGLVPALSRELACLYVAAP